MNSRVGGHNSGLVPGIKDHICSDTVCPIASYMLTTQCIVNVLWSMLGYGTYQQWSLSSNISLTIKMCVWPWKLLTILSALECYIEATTSLPQTRSTLSQKCTYYSCIMLSAFWYLLFPKLCQYYLHAQPYKSSYEPSYESSFRSANQTSDLWIKLRIKLQSCELRFRISY